MIRNALIAWPCLLTLAVASAWVVLSAPMVALSMIGEMVR